MLVDQTLRPAGRRAANDADRGELIHLFGLRQKQRHGAKRFSPKIHVQSGDDDANSTVGQLIADSSHLPVEELDFIYGYNIYVRLNLVQDVLDIRNRSCRKAQSVVRDYSLRVIAIVKKRFENLHVLTSDSSPFESPDQLFCFAAEHAAAYQLNPSGIGTTVYQTIYLLLDDSCHHLRSCFLS